MANLFPAEGGFLIPNYLMQLLPGKLIGTPDGEGAEFFAVPTFSKQGLVYYTEIVAQ
jgi:hypothetical protein